MPKFMISRQQIHDGRTRILGSDARHISKILRLGHGDELALTDGSGRDLTGIILEASLAEIVLEITDDRQSDTESPLGITLGSGMLKHQKMDLVIKNATQLGIHEWIPFFCERSIPRPDPKGLDKKQARWEAIAAESVKQCLRSRLPRICRPMEFHDLLKRSDAYDTRIAFWENSSRPLSDLQARDLGPDNRVLILIGPEGGFSQKEVDMLEAKGFLSFSLGPRILRAENASITACALVQHILGDM